VGDAYLRRRGIRDRVALTYAARCLALWPSRSRPRAWIRCWPHAARRGADAQLLVHL